MSLAAGARLGAYEIVGPLGAGGMGEVYRARDTRLDRTVALKVLPPRFAERADLRERFEREARVVSSLNHPHICTLYDVGHDNGTAFFVMEFIEGQPLAEKLERGPLPLDQLLRIAIDVGDALAKAHRHGVVHRDLKPANVMLTRSGAKLLDFGLARRADATSGAIVMPDAPTMAANAAPLTAEGTIVGTLQYMAPEQLDGSDVDGRSDLFSFGAMLYEMTTGRRAFEASSHASLIAKIMSEEPRPVSELQPVTPKRLERLIHRCLAKDPDARWQCAGDVVAELRAIESGAPEVAPTTRARSMPWRIAAAALAVVAIVLASLLMRRTESVPPRVQFGIAPPPDSVFAFDVLATPIAVSPDGERIALIAQSDDTTHLYVRALGDAQAQRIDGTAGATAPFWSPDGHALAFFAHGKLQTVRDGNVQTLCNVTAGSSYAGTWSSDGTILYSQVAANDGLYRVPASGGTPVKLPPVKELYGYHYPRFLSDGKRFLFTGIDIVTPSLWVGSLDGTPPRRLADRVSHVDYVPPYVVYARDGAVVAQRFDEDELKLIGTPTPLVSNVRVYWPIGASAHAAGGRTVVAMPNPAPKRMVFVSRTGVIEGEAAPAAAYWSMATSPDGRKIAAAVGEVMTGVASLVVIDVNRKISTRLTFGESDHESPIWAPDGKRIVFASDVAGPPHLFIKTLGSTDQQELVPVGGIQEPTDWIAGDRIFFFENGGESREDIMVVTPGRKAEVWLRTPFNERHADVSPDGKWVAFSSDQSGSFEVYLAPIDAPGDAIRVTSSGGDGPHWNRDGSELFYVRGKRDVMAMRFANGDAGEPVRLFEAPSTIGHYDVMPDGRFLLRIESDPQPKPLQVVVNWTS